MILSRERTRNSFWVDGDEQTYSFPFAIKKTVGSLSTKRLFFIPLAQKAPYWGRCFEGILIESSQIRGGTEIVYRSFICGLVVRTAFNCFVLSKISHYIITF